MPGHRPAVVALFLLLIANGNARAEIQWVPRGPQDAHIISFVMDDYGGLTLIGTEFGYRVLTGLSTWTAYEEPGVPGRAVHGAVLTYFTGGVITGRVDAEGHGYLEHDVDSAQGDVVYSSTCGPFVDVAGSDYDFPGLTMWACSRAGDTPGELVVSRDRGQTWEVVTGHGQQDFYDLIYADWTPPGVYVAGDAGIAFTPDEGQTWQDLSAELPATEVRRLWEMCPVTGLPDKDRVTRSISACTESGLFVGEHDADLGQCVWNATPEIAGPVRGMGWFFYDYPLLWGSIALTDDGRILVDSRGTGWQDLTGALAGLEIVGVESTLLVATADHGTWALTGLLTAVGDDPPRPSLGLVAIPNPFNPATTLRYAVAQAGPALLTIHDLGGRLVATVLDRDLPAGPGEVAWRPQGLSSGVYVARLVAGGQRDRRAPSPGAINFARFSLFRWRYRHMSVIVGASLGGTPHALIAPVLDTSGRRDTGRCAGAQF